MPRPPSPPFRISAKDAQSLPLPLHRIDHGRAVCDAPEGGKCRLVCAENCGSEVWPCTGWDDDANDTSTHDMADQGECNVVLFLEAGYDLWESAEVDGQLESEPPPDGSIECEWDGDTYIWRYVEPSGSGASRLEGQ